MSTKHDSASPLSLTDPNREPIRVVDHVTFHPSKGLHLDITCSALVSRPVNGSEWVNEWVVTARFRMDLTMAKALTDGLIKQIAMIEAAKGTVN